MLRRSLAKLRGNVAAARRKQNLTVVMTAEPLGSPKSTDLKLEKGDPSVSTALQRLSQISKSIFGIRT
jgi:hypothetical protein